MRERDIERKKQRGQERAERGSKIERERERERAGGRQRNFKVRGSITINNSG